VKGTGEGQRVKGHKWERQMPAKLEARRKAMEGMPEMIRQWKQVSGLSLIRDSLYVLTVRIAGPWQKVEEVSQITSNEFVRFTNTPCCFHRVVPFHSISGYLMRVGSIP
jgi:Mitochondrial ribosomal protein mL59